MAITVTFDDPDHARACIDALSAQQGAPLERIVLVDNASRQRDELEKVVTSSSVPVDWLRMEANLGPAGGFHAGLRHFLEQRAFTHAWLMDDDVRPDPGCLAAQLASAEDAGVPCVVAPVLRDYDGTPHARWGWAGLLTSRSVVEEIGLPRADYFWGSEDGEWLLVRARDGYRIPLVRAEAATAQMAVRDPSRPKAPWKYYYETRNYAHSRLHADHSLPLTKRAKRVAHRTGKLARAAARERSPVATLAMVARGLVDGLVGRLGIRVTPGASDRMPSAP